MNKYRCYTDGSYQSSISAGGYASIICDEQDNIIKELYCGFKHTTNNRMEARAVLETLKYFKEPSDITIISDSMYVVNTIKEGWVKKWFEENDYSKSNLDIWFEILDYLDFHKITMEWVKGHSINKLNARADELCVFAAQCLNLPEDEHIDYGKESRKPLVSELETRRSNGIDVGSKDGEITYTLW